jgi:vanillate O-demethylase monooxygenase subunit
MAFRKNCWYVAGWASEIVADKPLARQIIGERLVFFRGSDDQAVALIDRCAHRQAPLSMGTLKDNCIECPYHGFRYAPDGTCIHNPHGDGHIPRSANIKAYPTIEKYSAVWVWMGDPDKADPSLVPPFEFLDPAHFYVGEGYLHANAGYLLEVDNIMDLSHIEFVHPIFSSEAVSKGEVLHEIDGETVWSKRMITNDTNPPDFIRQGFQLPEGSVDRWLNVQWFSPAYMSLYAGGVASGRPQEEGMEVKQVHWFTPETETTTHYFYGFSMPKAAGEWAEQMAKEQVQALRQPFEDEDLPLIEAQQLNISDAETEIRPMVLNVDMAGHSARRILQKQIKAEQEA